MENDQEIKYEEKYVAFFDILGFSDLIEQNKIDSVKTITKIKSTIKSNNRELVDTLERFIQNKNNLSLNYGELARVSIKMFSDCFCISNNHLITLIVAMQITQLFFATENIFIRGGIAKGLHYEDDDNMFIFSKGLVEAYKLESKKAIYPRILLHEDLICELQPNRDLFLKCEDSLEFIDFLEYIKYLDDETKAYCISEIREKIIEQIEHSENDRITQKYNWFVEYFNYKVKDTEFANLKIDTSVFKFAYKEYKFE